jgi:hypothetical protein
MMEQLREELTRKTADGTLTVEDVADARIDFLTAAETAVIMRCDPRTVRARCEDGSYPGIKIGDGWRVPVRWLLEVARVAA